MTPEQMREARRAAKKERVPVRKVILYMVILSVLFWWIAIEAYPFWTKLNLSASTIFTIPIYAFAGGLLSGFCVAHSRSGRQAMTFVGWMLGLIVTFFMGSILLGAFAILIGFSTDVADWVRDIALTVSLGSIAIVMVRWGAEVLMDKVNGLIKRPDGV